MGTPIQGGGADTRKKKKPKYGKLFFKLRSCYAWWQPIHTVAAGSPACHSHGQNMTTWMINVVVDDSGVGPPKIRLFLRSNSCFFSRSQTVYKAGEREVVIYKKIETSKTKAEKIYGNLFWQHTQFYPPELINALPLQWNRDNHSILKLRRNWKFTPLAGKRTCVDLTPNDQNVARNVAPQLSLCVLHVNYRWTTCDTSTRQYVPLQATTSELVVTADLSFDRSARQQQVGGFRWTELLK